MKNIIIAIVVVLVAVMGYMVMSKDQANAPGVSGSATPTVSASPTVSPTPGATTSPTVSPTVSPTKTPTPTASAVKTFPVSAQNFSFVTVDATDKLTSEIRVKKGDTVKIVFSNWEGSHDWGIDEFNARTPIIAAGKTSTIQFVADKTGTFEYYCSVGTHRQMGMKGNLIVE